jgi:hypothetical protein
MNGCSYRSMPKTDRAACAVACATDAACQGYSHNKISQTCELKHMLTALRLDPLWDSGAPKPGLAAESIRAKVMVTFPDALAADKNLRLVGKLIDGVNADSQACEDRCKSDQACVALEYQDPAQTCRRFSDVTGARPATKQEGSVLIEIKRQ